MTTTTLTPLPQPTDWAMARLAECDSSVRLRRLVEIGIVEHLVRALIEVGYSVDVDDGGEELALRNSRDTAEILDAVFAVDDSTLFVRAPGANRPMGWVTIILGNGPDCLPDHTVNLESVLKPTNDYAEALSAWF